MTGGRQGSSVGVHRGFSAGEDWVEPEAVSCYSSGREDGLNTKQLLPV